MKQTEQEFCMRQFKLAIAVMAVLIVVIMGWTLWRQCSGSFVHPTPSRPIIAATAAAVQKPPARNIDVNSKSTHPYLGTCNQCHITTGAGKPISRVMAGQPISIRQTMPHKYWGNCMLCHTVKDGWQANGQFIVPGEIAPQAQAADLIWLTAVSLGLTVQPVTETMLTQLKLAKEEGLLVITVAPGSLANKAGFRQGDEIVRVNKIAISRVDQFEAVLNQAGRGANLIFAIYRGKDSRKLYASLPKDLAALAVPVLPQVQAQTVPGLPQTTASLVAVAAMGAELTAPVAVQFEIAPYFIIIDQVHRVYRVEVNPNAGRPEFGVQTAQLMANLGVSVVMAGSFSQDALNTLAALGIAVYPGVTGGIQEVITTARFPEIPTSAAQQVGTKSLPQTLF